MSFRLASFIKAITDNTSLDVEVDTRVDPSESANKNSSNEQVDNEGSGCAADNTPEQAQPKA